MLSGGVTLSLVTASLRSWQDFERKCAGRFCSSIKYNVVTLSRFRQLTYNF